MNPHVIHLMGLMKKKEEKSFIAWGRERILSLTEREKIHFN